MKINISTTGGNFLKKEDKREIKHKTKLILVDDGQWIDQPAYKNPDVMEHTLQFTVRLPSGKEGLYKINKPSQRCLVIAFGDETSNWKGKEVLAWETKNPSGGDNYFVLTAIDWLRDDRGEWVIPDNSELDFTNL